MSTPRRPRRHLLALLLPLLLLLAGCSSIPTVGPVGTATAGAGGGGGTEGVRITPAGPEEGAAPSDIIDGFINAGAGTSEDYSVAREYLAGNLADSWSATDRVLVYGAEPQIVPLPEENTYQVRISLAFSIDADGIRTQAEPGKIETLTIRVTDTGNGWRISEVPNGIMLSQVNFNLVFTSHNLYFFSSTYEYWVPDTRWFVQRTGMATAIVKAMLRGPAPYLQGAVTSAFPAGTTLARDAVPQVNGVATVDLSADVLEEATDLNRQQMAMQLERNLKLNNINSVEMTANQRAVDLGSESSQLIQPQDGQTVPATQVAVLDGEIVFYENEQPRSIENFSASGYGAQDPAVSRDLAHFAFLDSSRNSLLVGAPNQPVREAGRGTELTAPSIDGQGWAWTAGSVDSGSEVLAAPVDGAGSTRISADWLAGKTVQSLRISREGARALLVARSGETTRIYLAGVVRSSEGAPSALTEPVLLRVADGVTSAKWAGEDTFVAVNDTGSVRSAPQVLSTGWREESGEEGVSSLAGISGLSVGNGIGQMFVVSSDPACGPDTSGDGNVGMCTMVEPPAGWAATNLVYDPAFAG